MKLEHILLTILKVSYNSAFNVIKSNFKVINNLREEKSHLTKTF